MTEAGKEWAWSQPNDHFTQRADEAEFWIRKFCEALESKAREFSEPDDNCDGENICLGMAYKDIKRELLG